MKECTLQRAVLIMLLFASCFAGQVNILSSDLLNLFAEVILTLLYRPCRRLKCKKQDKHFEGLVTERYQLKFLPAIHDLSGLYFGKSLCLLYTFITLVIKLFSQGHNDKMNNCSILKKSKISNVMGMKNDCCTYGQNLHYTESSG